MKRTFYHFFTLARNNRTRNDKKHTQSKQFRGLKEFSDYCFRNVKEIRHYYHNRQVIESDARNSFRSFISAKSDEFWINDEIPRRALVRTGKGRTLDHILTGTRKRFRNGRNLRMMN